MSNILAYIAANTKAHYPNCVLAYLYKQRERVMALIIAYAALAGWVMWKGVA